MIDIDEEKGNSGWIGAVRKHKKEKDDDTGDTTEDEDDETFKITKGGPGSGIKGHVTSREGMNRYVALPKRLGRTLYQYEYMEEMNEYQLERFRRDVLSQVKTSETNYSLVVADFEEQKRFVDETGQKRLDRWISRHEKLLGELAVVKTQLEESFSMGEKKMAIDNAINLAHTTGKYAILEGSGGFMESIVTEHLDYIRDQRVHKAVSVGAVSGEAGYAMVPKVVDGGIETKKIEDDAEDELKEYWAKVERELKSGLKEMYSDFGKGGPGSGIKGHKTFRPSEPKKTQGVVPNRGQQQMTFLEKVGKDGIAETRKNREALESKGKELIRLSDLSYAIQKEGRRVDSEELDNKWVKVGMELMGVKSDIAGLNREREVISKKNIEAFLDVCGQGKKDNPVKLKTKFLKPYIKRRCAGSVSAAEDFLGRMISEKIHQKAEMFVGDEKDRAKFESGKLHIPGVFDEGCFVSKVVHEYCHILEDTNPKIHKSCIDFLEKRTKGEKAESLNTIFDMKGFGANEVAKKDHFMSPYMGKIYPEEVGQTELLSMGLEQLSKDPLNVSEKDPEYFDWLLETLRGD